MKVKVFITSSLSLLTGWLGLAYMHQVDMASYSASEDNAPKISANATDLETSKEETPLTQQENLGTLAAE